MLVRRVAVENVRSFLERQELALDGDISILIGPNGGGKTNLLDAVVIILRRYLFAAMYAQHTPTAEQPDRYEFRHNDVLNNMILERYHGQASRDQLIEIELEVTEKDLDAMRSMQADAARLSSLAGKKYYNLRLHETQSWKLDGVGAGTRYTYRLVNGNLQTDGAAGSHEFLQFLQIFEMDGRLRQEFEIAPLAMPLVYLPVNRTASGFQSNVQLAGYNEFDVKRQSDAAMSRSGTQIVSLAVGSLAQKYRLLLEKDKGSAMKEFREDRNLQELTKILGDLGYDWSLFTVDALKNQYDVRLRKQGTSFLVSAASSGERELLTYLFAIFALNVRDALVIVDEPELHLHPTWQKTLLSLFIRLAETTGNQFLLATHAPTFVSPESIRYVSRVFSREQKSQILRLDTDGLPDARHLLNIINTQNNERLFFADAVVLVEGLSDRIFFEAVLDRFGRSAAMKSVVEVVSVGGKGLFDAYTKVLKACQIDYSIIADRDYVEQIGSPEVKVLFKTDSSEIKRDVIENVKSLDGDALVREIEQAIATSCWDEAREVWDYIRSRRRRLREDLCPEQEATLERFLDSKRKEQIYVLKRGTLEDYLPAGHASKDLEKLIRLVASSEFWESLPEGGRAELQSIAQGVLRNATGT